MLGLVLALFGLMWALMLPAYGTALWGLVIAGLTGIAGGLVLALRAASTHDRSLPANDKRLPPARVLPRR